MDEEGRREEEGGTGKTREEKGKREEERDGVEGRREEENEWCFTVIICYKGHRQGLRFYLTPNYYQISPKKIEFHIKRINCSYVTAQRSTPRCTRHRGRRAIHSVRPRDQ